MILLLTTANPREMALLDHRTDKVGQHQGEQRQSEVQQEL